MSNGFDTRRVQTAIEDFSASTSPNDLWQRLHRHLENFGVGGIIYGTEALPDPTAEIAPLFNSINPSWLEAKLSNGLFEEDEYVRAARVDVTPMLWSDASLIALMSPTAKRSYALDVDYNILSGVSIPMRFCGNLGASSAGLHATSLSGPEFERIWSEHSASLIAMVNAFDLVLRQEHITSVFALKPQERECLQLSAAGLLQKQIADRLRLSEKQVERRLTSARSRLKSATIPQAVACALIYGLINP